MSSQFKHLSRQNENGLIRTFDTLLKISAYFHV
jgi:hypothetical protein